MLTRRTWILLALLLLVAGLAAFVGPPAAEEGPTRQRSDAALRSLPYLTWVPANGTLDKKGVTLHDPERAYRGVNLYAPRESHRAFLIDMEGEVLHRWEAYLDETDAWQLVEPLEGGSILVVIPNRRLIRIDRDSEITWRLDRRVHHDVAVAADGGLYVLAREEREIERDGRRWPILDDVILRVAADGEITGHLSLYPLMGEMVTSEQWAQLEAWLVSEAGRQEMETSHRESGHRLPNGSPADLFHTNSVEILTEGLPGVAAPGALLISVRELSVVAIVDFDAARLDWAWGPGIVRRQHHPSLLDDGSILIFDNLGGTAGTSRVLEVEPRSGEIVWEFNGDPPRAFHSTVRGGSQRLPNGNTLVTESDRGRVFEITRDGEMVWEYYNPIIRPGGEERSAIYRMVRLDPEAVDWLD